MQVATKSDGSRELWMEGAVRQRMRKGTSGYTFRKLVTHFMKYDDRLRYCAVAVRQYHWLLFMLFGVGILIHVLPRYFLTGSGVPGFPFLASIIAIFSGAQLFALGIIGEYLVSHAFPHDGPAQLRNARSRCNTGK